MDREPEERREKEMRYPEKARAILEIMRRSPKLSWTPTELGTALEYPMGQESARTSSVLKRMAKEGLIEEICRHHYRASQGMKGRSDG